MAKLTCAGEDFEDVEVMGELLRFFSDTYGSLEVLSDMSPFRGLDWAMAALIEGLPLTAVVPWAEYGDDVPDAEVLAHILEEADDERVLFLGGAQYWKSIAAMQEVIRKTDIVLLFHKGQKTDYLIACAQWAKNNAKDIWAFDITTLEYEQWLPAIPLLEQKRSGDLWIPI